MKTADLKRKGNARDLTRNVGTPRSKSSFITLICYYKLLSLLLLLFLSLLLSKYVNSHCFVIVLDKAMRRINVERTEWKDESLAVCSVCLFVINVTCVQIMTRVTCSKTLSVNNE